jgi:hypothetical protein
MSTNRGHQAAGKSALPSMFSISADHLELYDREAPLFLTHRRKPYSPNEMAYGGQNKTAFRAMKRRTIETLRREAAWQALVLWRHEFREGAREVIGECRAQAQLIGQVTQHWLRHLLATSMLSMTGDLRAVMDQGGWIDSTSVLGYAHDVPKHRHALVRSLVPIDTALPREKIQRRLKR